MTVPSDASSGASGNWLFKNKEHGKTSAAASLVCIPLPCGFSPVICSNCIKYCILLFDRV